MKNSNEKNIFIGRIFLFILLLSTDLVFAQIEVLDHFPIGQNFYVGGKTFLMKEMVNVAKEKGLSPCTNSNERYLQKVLIYEDGSAAFIKDEDTANVQVNRCAYEFGRNVLSSVPKKWLPAKENVFTPPKLKKGSYYNNEVSRIMSSHIHKNELKRSSLSFVVNEFGDIEDVQIVGSYTDAQKSDIRRDLMTIKGQWIPASFNNIPMKYRVTHGFLQEFDVKEARVFY